jgi:hypothetical protein
MKLYKIHTNANIGDLLTKPLCSGGPRNLWKPSQTRLSGQILDKTAIENHKSQALHRLVSLGGRPILGTARSAHVASPAQA